MITTAKPRILVTGATGGVGTPLVGELLAKGFAVRAVVRGHDARSAALARLGAEIAVADLYDADQLTAAAQGTQAPSLSAAVPAAYDAERGGVRGGGAGRAAGTCCGDEPVDVAPGRTGRI